MKKKKLTVDPPTKDKPEPRPSERPDKPDKGSKGKGGDKGGRGTGTGGGVRG